MTQHELALWKKIESFQLDDQGASFKFSLRLARENGWNLSFSERVIEEYKKFIFLCCISEKTVTPSDAVDQAWHLHLTYTKSYWIEFCQETLEKQIHHNPTKGGDAEAEKFDECYTGTKSLYKQKFNLEPPADIWPDNEARFSDINFERVNMKRFWLIRKPSFSMRKMITVTCLLISAGISIMASGNNYLGIFFAVFLIVAVLASIFGSRNNNSGGSSGCSTAACGADSDGHSGCSTGCGGAAGCGGGD